MRRMVAFRVLLVGVAAGAACFGLARADSVDLPNTLADLISPRLCPGAPSTECNVYSGTNLDCSASAVPCVSPVNMEDIFGLTGAVSRRLTSAVKFRKGSDYYYFTPITIMGVAGCGDEINQCSCDHGADIAARGLNQYAKKALDDVAPCAGYATYQVVKNGGSAPCPANPAVAASCTCTSSANSASCTNVVRADSVTLKIQRTDFTPSSVKCGFTLFKDSGTSKFEILDDPPCFVVGMAMQSNSTNVAAIDMFPQYLVQVNPNGHDGIVNVSAQATENSAPVSCAPYNTSGKTFSQIQNDIAACLNGLPLGLSTVVDSGPGNSEMNRQNGTTDPGPENATVIAQNLTTLRYANGPVVRVRNARDKAWRISVQGQDGMIIQQEGSFPTQDTPALSEWGMILVALLLLTSGYWLLRSQRKQLGA